MIAGAHLRYPVTITVDSVDIINENAMTRLVITIDVIILVLITVLDYLIYNKTRSIVHFDIR